PYTTLFRSQLLIHQPDADGQSADMVARRLDHPGCHRQRLLFEDAQNLGSLPTAQAVRFETARWWSHAAGPPSPGSVPGSTNRETNPRRGRQRARASAGNSAKAAHACGWPDERVPAAARRPSATTRAAAQSLARRSTGAERAAKRNGSLAQAL